jgi:prepilin-type N-terminal cleavage/methylation domain-containing protein/prepilin-type processing-associated H-X9-DG protein
MNSAKRGHRHQRGFTLTEMLVVLGIIVVLASILLPAVMAAKRQSRKTVCEARLRAIGQALQLYLMDNDQYFPPACNSNSLDSSQSRIAFRTGGVWSPSAMGGFLPLRPYGPSTAVAYHTGPPEFLLPLVPVAYFLQKAAPVTEKVWSCPAMRNGKAGFFRTYQYVQTPWPPNSRTPNFDLVNGPLTGMEPGSDEFKPGYQFMGGVEFWWSIFSGEDEVSRRKYHYDQFATRNLAGLRLTDLKPQGGQASAEVVTFADYSVMAHSKETDDMWQPDLNKRMGNYSANFLYLDGHVEYHEFNSITEYFKVLHRPIPQTWGARKIQSVLSAPDVWNP